eukprot:CAMPEP_0205814020 /NCGR_PEP_ID=MMETSP0205-20121125/18915_1 /ASSEMBLY_ACC=CAM_ASM_000278 /TAXON_ID=36767 /ORGANISM="Euplotes focardii, Strain TN1" /LENGTH=56 /DNA_ID=CAMNT_0053097163 /DNA_START=17 /DNA_END=184 /DNA_ORIENTATION=+
MLNYIQKRYESNHEDSPTEVERKFIDIIKAVIEGGYTIKEKEFFDILSQITTPEEV